MISGTTCPGSHSDLLGDLTKTFFYSKMNVLKSFVWDCLLDFANRKKSIDSLLDILEIAVRIGDVDMLRKVFRKQPKSDDQRQVREYLRRCCSILAAKYQQLPILKMLVEEYNERIYPFHIIRATEAKYPLYDFLKYVVEKCEYPDDDRILLMTCWETQKYRDLWAVLFKRDLERFPKQEVLDEVLYIARSFDDLPLLKVIIKHGADVKQMLSPELLDESFGKERIIDQYLREVVSKKEVKKDPKIVSAITKVAGKDLAPGGSRIFFGDLGGLISRYL